MEAADRITVPAVVVVRIYPGAQVVPVHPIGKVVQVAIPSVGRPIGRRRPEEGVVTQEVEPTIAEAAASRKSVKTAAIITIRIIRPA